MRSPRVLALYNSKGGVGKTSCCVNLAWTAAHQGTRVLLWDLDPQGAASFYLRQDQGLARSTRKLIQGKASWKKEILDTDFAGLSVIPADPSLRHFDLLAEEEKHSKRLLEQGLESLPSSYDVIFLDCPPGLSLVTENVFRAADLVLVPVVPSPLSLRTLDHVTDFVSHGDAFKRKIRPFVSLADLRKSLHRNFTQEIHSQDRSLKTVIPQMAEMERMGQDFRPSALREKSRSRGIFQSLWQEIQALDSQKHS